MALPSKFWSATIWMSTTTIASSDEFPRSRARSWHPAHGDTGRGDGPRTAPQPQRSGRWPTAGHRSKGLQSGTSRSSTHLLDFGQVRAALTDTAAYFVYPIRPASFRRRRIFARPRRGGVEASSTCRRIRPRGRQEPRRDRPLALRAPLRLVGADGRPHPADLLAEWLLYLAPISRPALHVPFGTGKHGPDRRRRTSRVIAAS